MPREPKHRPGIGAGRHQGHRPRARHFDRHGRPRAERQAGRQRGDARARPRPGREARLHAEPRRALPPVAQAAAHLGPPAAAHRALLGRAARGHPRGRGAVRAGAARRLPHLPEPRRRRHPAARAGARRRHRRPDHRARATRRPGAATSRKAARRNIPVVCVVTDAPDSPRLLVGLRRSVHGRRGRRRAARPLPARRRPGRASSPAGWRRRITPTSCAASRRACRRSAAGSQLGPIVEAHDDEREAHRRARRCCGRIRT